MSSSTDIISAVQSASELGHPLGECEIVPAITDIPEMLQILKDIGYVAEGEHGLEVSPAGQISRMTIKYRPRESLLAKLINRFNLNANISISPKDFLG
jgi:hypothetical protein